MSAHLSVLKITSNFHPYLFMKDKECEAQQMSCNTMTDCILNDKSNFIRRA